MVMNERGHLDLSQPFSRFWLRRLCEVSLFMSGALLSMYTYARFVPTGNHFPLGEHISDFAAITSAITFLISLILCFWLPKRFTTLVGSAVYLMIISTIAALIWTSGRLNSPFTMMWPIAAVFAGVFGAWMAGGIALLLVTQIIALHLQQPLSVAQMLSALLIGVAPVIISFILWHRQPKQKTTDAVAELTNKLSSAEGKSDVVINTINDGVLAISSAGNIELINPAAQQMIGWNQGDALGLQWQSVLKLVLSDGSDVAEHEHPIAQALATNQPTHNDKLLLRTSADKRRPISIVSSPVGTQGEGIIVVFRDISKEMAEEREQAEFISTASHEMRTPVASIEGYLGLALNPATAQIDEKARDFITKAHASAQHLGRLFQDLLDVSRAEDGRLKNEPRVVDVAQFVGDIAQGLGHLATEKGLAYEYRPSAATGPDQRLQPIYFSFIDPDHLREVTANLIENAIKYTLQGQVIIDVTGNNTQVVISVQDSGIGIPAEDLPHLFQKFYRVDNSDTREIGGTGLGLYLSRRLAENMGGTLQVTSDYGKGSTFSLIIPRLSHEEASQRMAQQSTAPEPITPATAMPPQLDQAPQPSAPVSQPYTPLPPAPQQAPQTISQPVAPAQPQQSPSAPQPAVPLSYTPLPQQMPIPPQPAAPTLAQIEQQMNAGQSYPPQPPTVP